MRNTDSFFKDDNGETRKINLTPSLLRDDSSSNLSGESREVCLLSSISDHITHPNGRTRREAASMYWKRQLPHPIERTTSARTSEAFLVAFSSDEIARASSRLTLQIASGPIKKSPETTLHNRARLLRSILKRVSRQVHPSKNLRHREQAANYRRRMHKRRTRTAR